MQINPIVIHESVKQIGYQVLLQENVYGKGGAAVPGPSKDSFTGCLSNKETSF